MEALLDQPQEKIAFSVMVMFNMDHGRVRRRIKPKDSSIQTDFVPTYHMAADTSRILAVNIAKGFKGSSVLQIPDNADTGEPSHLVIRDDKDYIAKLVVSMEDYREKTIH